MINWNACFRWSFGPNYTWGSIETTTIGKMHPRLFYGAYSMLYIGGVEVGALFSLPVGKNRRILILAPDRSENKAFNPVDLDVPLELVILVGTHH